MKEAELKIQLDQYKGYLANDPANANLIQRCADLQMQLGDFDRARDLLYEGLRKHPGHHALLFLLATVEISANQAEVAVDILKSLLSKGVDNAGLRYNLAYALGLMGNMEEAKDILAATIDTIYLEYPETKVLLAKLYHHLGEMETVVDCLQNFLVDHPDHVEANGQLALAYVDMEDYSAAREWGEKALALGSSQEGLLALGMVELEGSEPNLALERFSQAAQLRKNSGRAAIGQGLACMLKGDLVAAENFLQQGSQWMPSHLGSWNALAWAQIAMQKPEAAKDTLNQAMELNRNFSETHGALAMVHFVLGNFEDARLSARRAKGLDANSFSAAYVESLLMVQQGGTQQAQAMVAEILKRPINEQGKTLELEITKFASKRKNEQKLQ